MALRIHGILIILSGKASVPLIICLFFSFHAETLELLSRLLLTTGRIEGCHLKSVL